MLSSVLSIGAMNIGVGIWLGIIFSVLLVLFFFGMFVATRYKRCPSNRVLVVYGRVGGSNKASKCLHGGGTFVWPLIQDYAYLNLEPLSIDIPLEGALSMNNIRVNVPSTFTVGISTNAVLMNNAAERLLNLSVQAIREQAQDIILGQLRLVIATLTIEEINRDREKFMHLINENVDQEINKIGLLLINVNIRDITDESGYIQAIGKRAAAEAIERAKVEVAQQERDGATGESIAVRERTVNVARERAAAVEGEKQAEQRQRVAVAALEAEAVRGEVQARRDREIAIAQREAEAAASIKLAEQEQRIKVAEAEAEAVAGEATSRRNMHIAVADRQAEVIAAEKAAEQQHRIKVAEAEARAKVGENDSQAFIADSNAKLGEIQADARRRAEVAAAKAAEAVLIAEREQEMARLAKEEIVPQEIERQRIEIAAEAEAEKRRREARGEADAILFKFEAEAKGMQRVLEAKAEGYRKLIEACGSNPQIAPTLLLIEHLPALVAEQVKAIQNLKIDKITVWDTGAGHHGSSNGNGTGRSTTADWLAGMVGSLPRLHELAQQAGIELPSALGRVGTSAAEPPLTGPAVKPVIVEEAPSVHTRHIISEDAEDGRA
jgi:flotillin